MGLISVISPFRGPIFSMTVPTMSDGHLDHGLLVGLQDLAVVGLAGDDPRAATPGTRSPRAAWSP